MKLFNLSWSLCALMVLAAGPVEAKALPADRTISYTLYEDAYASPLVALYVVEFDLSASDSDGNSIGWEVTELRIIQKSGGDTVWTDTSPTVDTSDGLWWITHADGDNPTLSEFDELPLIEGVGTPDEPTEDDMEFSFDSDAFSPPANEPFDVTTSLNCLLQKSEEPEPDLEAEDLPAKVGNFPTS